MDVDVDVINNECIIDQGREVGGAQIGLSVVVVVDAVLVPATNNAT